MTRKWTRAYHFDTNRGLAGPKQRVYVMAPYLLYTFTVVTPLLYSVGVCS